MLKNIFILLSLIYTILFINFYYTTFTLPVLILLSILIFISGVLVHIGLHFIFLLFVSFFISMKKTYKKENKFISWLFYYSIELTYWMFRIKVKVTGLEKLDNVGTCMMIYNHTSNFDPIVQTFIFRKHKCIHISKPENFKIIVCGKFMHRMGFISIDRENHRKGLEAILKAVKSLQTNEASVCVSPEGTRNRKEGLLPFHAGTFKIAQKANVPIVVCTLKNFDKIKKNCPFRSTHVTIDVTKIITPEEYKGMSTNDIAKYTRGIIADELGITLTDNNNENE